MVQHGGNMSTKLTQEVILFNQTGEEYKMISNTLHITKNIVAMIIQKFNNDKKTSG